MKRIRWQYEVDNYRFKRLKDARHYAQLLSFMDGSGIQIIKYVNPSKETKGSKNGKS